MSLRWTSLLALPLFLIAAGCKEGSEKGDSAVPAGFDASAPRNIPERARFGKKSEVWTPKTEAFLGRTRALASHAGPSGPAVDDASLYRDGAAFFDGARFDSQSMVVRAGMAIDTDGPVKSYDRRVHRDPYRQKETSLRYKDGSSLDPTTVPYVVVPISKKSMLGDLAVVEYQGRKTLAVVGDCGPRFGEASVALAERLGIPADGVSGGVNGGVTYSFYPGPGRKFSGEQELMAFLASGGQPSL